MKKEELVIDVNDLSLNSLLDEFVQTQSPQNTSGTTTFSEVVEEELEWLNKDAFPEVDFGIFSMSPVSVLNDGCRNKTESNGNGRTFTNSSESFKVARRTRTGKRRACCDKWLFQPEFPPWDQVRAIKESSVVLSSLPTKRANGGAALVMGRKCSHCQTNKTPQWRLGPMGPKTLCNACGVRFKSGRLFPEYRPACSPTFSSALHSNSHRKVIEMRRQKQISTGE